MKHTVTLLHRLIAASLLICVSSSIYAQFTTTYNVFVKYVAGDSAQAKIKPAQSGTVVYFFNEESKANAAHKQLSSDDNIYHELPKDRYGEMLKVKNGKATGKIGTYKYCFAYDDNNLRVWPVHTIKNGETDFELIFVQSKTDRRLEDVLVKGDYKANVNGSTMVIRGRNLPLHIQYMIAKKKAEAKNRYVLVPTVYVVTDTTAFTSKALKEIKMDSVLFYSYPILKDGDIYHKTMERRMGFDLAHDNLSQFVDTTDLVETNKRDYYFVGDDTIRNINFSYRYPVYAERWTENYTTILEHDSVLVSDGFAPNPFRFLDFKIDDAEIDMERYWHEPTGEIMEDKTSLDLNFQKGKSSLEDNDSIGFAQINKIKDKIEAIIANDGNVYGVTVFGQASPDGGYEINDKLSRGRAAYVASIIQRYANVKSNNAVAKWSEIADLLAKDSVKGMEFKEKALEVRDIVASTSDMRNQEAKLRKLPYWSLLDSVYLPKLRKTDVFIEYKERHTWTREEVEEKYEKDKKWMPTEPYQFCYLFEYLKSNPAEIKRYAKKAMEISNANNEAGDPWPLAAFYYAKSIMNEGGCDSTILSPYIAIDSKKPIDSRKLIQGRAEGDWVNDKAIVLLQIRMLAADGQYDRASIMVNTLFSNADTLKALLDCLANGPGDDKSKQLISSTSSWNKVIMLSAEGIEKSSSRNLPEWHTAYNMLLNDSIFDHDNGREFYQLAVLAKRLCGAEHKLLKDAYPTEVFDFNEQDDHILDPNNEIQNGIDHPDYGGWMVKACEMDPSLINVLRLDGEFSQAYRDGFANYWNTLDPKTHRHLR